MASAPAAFHVVPLADLCEHACTLDCWCQPTRREGLVIHHAADGREDREALEETEARYYRALSVSALRN